MSQEVFVIVIFSIIIIEDGLRKRKVCYMSTRVVKPDHSQ